MDDDDDVVMSQPMVLETKVDSLIDAADVAFHEDFPRETLE